MYIDIYNGCIYLNISLYIHRYSVVLCDVSKEALERARLSIQAIITSAVKRGLIRSPKDGQVMMHRLSVSTDLHSLSTCDLVIEAVYEDLKVKQDVFKRLDFVCRSTCIIASNTSSLDIDLITCQMSPDRAEYVVGMHFFTPAHIMKLVEIVQCKHTSVRILGAVLGVTKRLGKIGVVVANLPGFVGNRCIFTYVLESMLLLEESYCNNRGHRQPVTTNNNSSSSSRGSDSSPIMSSAGASSSSSGSRSLNIQRIDEIIR
jgi:3-hydroxyacyl-CoA dehydrogenase